MRDDVGQIAISRIVGIGGRCISCTDKEGGSIEYLILPAQHNHYGSCLYCTKQIRNAIKSAKAS